MRRKLRINLRIALFGIAALAIVFAVIRETRFRYTSRYENGTLLIRTYYSLKPAEIGASNWADSVNYVHAMWGNLRYFQHIPVSESEDILNRLQVLVSRANPNTSEGHLHAILDLIGHARETYREPIETGKGYICGEMWEWRMENGHDPLDSYLRGDTPLTTGVFRFALDLIGAKSEDPVAALSLGIDHQDWRVRAIACRGLKDVGLDGRRDEAIAALSRALKDPDALVREIAIRCLRRFAPLGSAAIPGLLHVTLREESGDVHDLADDTLKRLHGFGEAAPALLNKALEDPDYEVRAGAINRLGISPDTEAAIKGLVAVLEKEPSPIRRSAAAHALGRIKDASCAVPTLIRALGDKNPFVRRNAAEILGKGGRAAIPAILPLEAMRQEQPAGSPLLRQEQPAGSPLHDAALRALISIRSL